MEISNARHQRFFSPQLDITGPHFHTLFLCDTSQSSAGNMGPSELALLVGITSLLACQLLWEMLWSGCEIHTLQGLCLSMLGPQLFEEGGELFGMGGVVGRCRHKG